MSHAAVISGLLEDLANSIVDPAIVTQPNNATPAVKAFKENALRSLTRYHRFGRTNQFAVQKSLEGLIEKFQVLNKDDLADALGDRLKDLATVESKWTPDILALLLFLSDHPVAKARVEDLDRVQPPFDGAPQPTWDEIFGPPQTVDDALWHEDSSTFDSAEDDADSHSVPDIESLGKSQSPIGATDVDIGLRAESLVLAVDTSVIRDFENNVDNLKPGTHGAPRCISELQAARQILHMLRDLPTNLFEFDEKSAGLHPVSGFVVDHMSRTVFNDLLSSCGELGSSLHTLRKFMSARLNHPILRTFAYVVEQQVSLVDDFLTSVEKSFVEVTDRVVVSLLHLYSQLENQLSHLSTLKNLAAVATTLQKGECFKLLDYLYDCSCDMQESNDVSTFAVLASAFLHCLGTYLRPIRQWMVEGHLGEDLEMISTPDSNSVLDPATFWERRFSLKFRQGHPAAPRFLLPFVQKIYSSGKSVAFTKELGIETYKEQINKADEVLLRIDLSADSKARVLLPFTAVIEKELDEWVSTRHQLTSLPLSKRLLHDFGVQRIFMALEHVYLSRNGAIFNDFVDRAFTRMDGMKNPSHATYAVEDIAQNTFSALKCIDPSCISVKATASPEQRGISAVQPSNFAIFYEVSSLIPFFNQRRSLEPAVVTTKQYPWSVQNIIPRASLETYRQACSILMQARRASGLLSQHRFRATDRDTKNQHHRSLHLHHRLLHFTAAFQDYMLHSAIQPTTLAMHAALTSAADVDAMVAAHATFVVRLQRRFLLEDSSSSSSVRDARSALDQLLALACAFAAELRTAAPLALPSSSAAAPARPADDASGDADDGDSESEPADDDEDAGGGAARAQAGAGAVAVDPAVALPRLRRMEARFSELLAAAVASLRSAAREHGAEPAWEELCERLEWSLAPR